MKPKSLARNFIAALLVTGLGLTSALHALPKGEQVKAGSASFNRSGPVLGIRAADRTIIDYRNFNIARGEKVIFIQPGSNSIVLNRVLDANPTRIFGTIEANGRIALANPYGIFFENGSVLNVGGLIAGAGHISDSDFLAGRMNFTSLTGEVTNRGTIVAIDDVALYGEHVSNEGSITSQKGAVSMLAGSSVYVGETGGNIFVGTAPEIPKAKVVSSPKPGVSNSGTIKAPKVMLATGDMYGMAIAQSGNIIGSDITLAGGKGGSVAVSGTVDASNRTAGKRGGKVKILGEKVAVNGATIDASGDAGGGKILVGGDYKGGGTVRRAKTTTVDSSSKLAADAITGGRGGKVIVWSDEATFFAGSITARGGAQGGDGGLVETSGKLNLGVTATALVDASASLGKPGLWLMDPQDVDIVSPPGIIGFAVAAALAADTVIGPPGGAGVFAIDPLAIQTALQTGGGTNVTITTDAVGVAPDDTGNITVTDAVTWNTPSTLTLQADGSIFVNNSIIATGNGSLTLNANTAPTGSVISSASSGASGTIDLGAGTLTVAAGSGGINLAAAPVIANTFNFTSTGAVTVNNAGNNIANVGVTPSTGTTIDIRSTSLLTVGAGAGTGITATGGSLTLTSDIGVTSPLGGAIDVGATGTLTVSAGTPGIVLSGPVTANTFNFDTGFDGPVTVNNPANNIANVASAFSNGTSIDIFSASTLTVGVGGISATGAVTLTSGGNIQLNGSIEAFGVQVNLVADGDITQSLTEHIWADSLRAVATNGFVSLNGTENFIATLAGSANGSFSFLNADSLVIGTVGPTQGVSSTNGNVLIRTNGADVFENTPRGDITVQAPITAATGSVTLSASAANDTSTSSPSDAITIAEAILAAGTVSLTSTSSSITESLALGTITANALLARAAINVDLSAANAIGVGGVAGVAGDPLTETGFFILNNAGPLGVATVTDSVGTVTGITAFGPNTTVLVAAAGDIIQVAPIVSAGGLLASAAAGSIVLDLPNVVTGNFTAAAAGNVTFRNTGNINVGPVTESPAFGPAISGNGITASTVLPAFIQLTSETGTIGQDSGAGARIVGGELRLATTNQNATLGTVINSVTNLGTVTLGTGALTLLDAGGLTVTGVVGATGGVTLNTSGALAINNALNATGATVSLTTTGAGNAITQTGAGVITANTLTLTTANANATLDTATNAVANLGTVALGAGAFAFRDDAAAGLTVNAITANAGIDITNTTGSLTTIGNLAVTAGSISLNAAAPGRTITLGGSVTASDNVTLVSDGAIDTGANLVQATGGTATLTSNSAGVNVGAGGLTAGTTASLAAGGAGTITQAAAGVITAPELILATAGGNATLDAVTNAITNLGTVTLGGGALNLLDAGGLTVTGTVGATGGVTLTTSGALTINNAVNAGAGNVTLTATIGSISQAGAGVLTGSALSPTAATGSVLLDTLSNNFATFAASAPTAGQAVRYRDTDAFDIAAPGIATNAANGLVALQSANAGGTLSGAITQTGPITGAELVLRAAQPGGSANLPTALNTPSVVAANVAGDFLYANTVAAGLEVGTVDGVLGITTPGAVTLTASLGNLTQTQAIAGPASSVSATATFGAVDLTNAGNAFGALTGSAALNFSAVDSVPLTVGAAGVTANGGNVVNLAVNGGGNSLSLTGLVTGGTVNLTADTDITQTAAGGVVSPNLQATATNGLVNLAAGAANNNVGTIAGTANGTFGYADANTPALTVGTVTTAGVTSTTGDVALSAVNGSLTVNQIVSATAAGGDVALLSGNDLSLNAPVFANAGNGLVSLQSTTGTVVEPALGAGLISGNALLARAAVNVDLFAVNAIGTGGVAGVAGDPLAGIGFFVLNNAGAIGVATVTDFVGTVAGITSFGPNTTVLFAAAGDITQVAPLTTAGGLLASAAAGNVVLDLPNFVTGNFTASAAGNVTFYNTGNINVGLVTELSATRGPISGNGITASTTLPAFVQLTSDTGTIGQDPIAGARIIGGELRTATGGGDVTLANSSNDLSIVGTVALGAGKFTLLDSTLGLAVNGPVTANGGVNIATTGGPLTLPGSIIASAGNIVLRSTDQDIISGGALAAGGLVQLDAGGLINQTGGSITGTSLIARATGNVALTQAGNDVANLAGFSSSGSFSYRDATAVSVESVLDTIDPLVVGITTTNQDITVVGGAGGVTGGVAVNAALNAGAGVAGGIVRLQTGVGDITQSAAITGSSLLANAIAGSVSLGGAVNNMATAVAGRAGGAGGSFRLRNLGGLNVGTVAGDGITTGASGISSNTGDIAIQTGGALTLIQTINAANGAAFSSPSSGTVRLRTTAGDITQAATGPIVGNGVLVDAAGSVSLTTAGASNDAQNLAGRAGAASFAYQDRNDLNVTSVTADGAGIGPVLPIGPLTSVSGAGASMPSVVLTAGGVLNVAAPLNVQSLAAKGTTINLADTQTVGDLIADTHFGTGVDGLVRLTGSSYTSTTGSVFLNPANRSVATRDATILSEAGNVTISAPLGNFTMGMQQKLLVDNGNLNISVGGTATVGDLAASGGLTMNATTALFQGRPPSNFQSQNLVDQGLSIVAPTVNFTGVANIGFAPGISPADMLVFISTNPNPPIGSVLSGAPGFSFQIDANQASQFHQADGNSKIQPIAGGTFNIDAGDINVRFYLVNLPHLIDLPEDLQIDEATKEILRKMGIEPRGATPGENISVSLHQGVFKQPIEGKAEMENPEYQVVTNRTTIVGFKQIAEEFLKLAGAKFEHIPEIALSLAIQVNNFRVTHPEVTDLTGFSEWLANQRTADKEADKLAQNLDKLAGVFVRLSQVGLTKKEIEICKVKICDDLKANLPDVEMSDMLLLVDGKSKPPAPIPPPGTPPPSGTPESPLPPPPPPPGDAPPPEAPKPDAAPASPPPPPAPK